MSDVASPTSPPTEDTAFVQFWNEVLGPKFIRFKHILVDGLSRHSEAVFPVPAGASWRPGSRRRLRLR